MIRVMFRADETLSLTVSGHAGAAEYGKDPVCASVSILAYTVAQAVSDLHDRGCFFSEPCITVESGFAKIECRPKPESYREAKHVFEVAQIGYSLLDHNYPEYVTLTKFGAAKAVNIDQKNRPL